jgi:hypothetical protein
MIAPKEIAIIMSASPSKCVRVAADILCVGLTGVALIHAAWAVGVKWLLHESRGGSTDWSVGLCIVSLLVVALYALAIVVTLARAGLRPTRLPDRFVRVGAWVIAAGLQLEVLAAAGHSAPWQRFGNGGVAPRTHRVYVTAS